MSLQSIILQSKKFVEMLYLDTMTVYRNQTITKPNGSKTTELAPVVGMIDIPCGISFNKLNYDNPLKETPITNPIQSKPKVFCGPDVNIKAGDVVWVTAGGKIYKGKASDDCVYDSHHIEFTLGIDTEA